jgi:L-lysine 6-transaminase
MQALCHEFDALFIVDEVQTGVGLTGTAWAYQQLGLEPDVVAFGKKTQVCGIMAGRRVDDVTDNVFRVPSRINSTWGGNLTDMVRARRILEVIEADGLIERAAAMGEQLLAGLGRLATKHPAVSDVRGRGLMCAITLPSAEIRNQVLTRLRTDERVLMLACGPTSLRVRPALTVTADEIDRGLAALDRVLAAVGS